MALSSIELKEFIFDAVNQSFGKSWPGSPSVLLGVKLKIRVVKNKFKEVTYLESNSLTERTGSYGNVFAGGERKWEKRTLLI